MTGRVTNLFRLFWEAWRDLLPTLRAVLSDLLKRKQLWEREKQLSERDRRRSRDSCVPVNNPAHKRPDPTIYSQSYLMKLGLAVTWDNPDIQLYKGGVPVSSSHLDRDSDYEIVARIWNNSTEAPVVDLPVRFSYLSFGVGTQNHTIGDDHVTLGVKGGPNHPAFAKKNWHTPNTPGHYCIQVLLDWPDDANPNNNLGQENTTVGELHSLVQFAFALRNPLRESLRYRFEVDTYGLPKRPPCSGVDKQRGPPTMMALQVQQEHDRRNYPLPSDWTVKIDPKNPELAPGDEQVIRVTVNAPGNFKGRQQINVNAFHRYGLSGGVTFYVEGK